MIGVGLAIFLKILAVFEPISASERAKKQKSDSERKRAKGAGRKSALPTAAHQLIFVLFYLKTYPTFDTLANRFGMSRGTAFKQLHIHLISLKKALEELAVLPKRSFDSPEEFKAYFKEQELDEIFIDATERAHFKYQDKDKRSAIYSGKKKKHTMKNTIISGMDKFVHYLGKTTQGSCHDYFMFKLEFKPKLAWFDTFKCWLDLGYQGIAKDYDVGEIKMPIKATSNKPLTQEDKDHNKAINKVRVFVEHAIAGIKRFYILVHTFRNKLIDFDDKVINLVSGLNNLNIINNR